MKKQIPMNQFQGLNKQMNIIFLDMDGVLNCSSFIDKWKKENGEDESSWENFKKKYCLKSDGPYLYYIVPELLKRFNDMYSKIPNCRIVWSSSWRLTTKKESNLFIEGLYNQCGLPNGSFLSYTPELRYTLRSDEIKKWIKIFRPSYSFKKIAIIDDLEEANLYENEYLGIPVKFFKTTMRYGLTQKIANDIVQYFNEENKND